MRFPWRGSPTAPRTSSRSWTTRSLRIPRGPGHLPGPKQLPGGDLPSGVELAYVLEGGMTVTAAGPVQVVRAGRGGRSRSGLDYPILLGPGDALLRPTSTTVDFATTGARSAHLVLGSLVPDYQVPPGWEMHDEDHVGGDRLSTLSGPAMLRLRRIVLAADAVFAAPPGAVAQVGVSLANPPALGTRSDGSLINVGTERPRSMPWPSSRPGRDATPAARS